MVDSLGRWTYEPNTPKEKQCDMDRVAELILDSGYKPKTNLENLICMLISSFESETEDSSSEFFPTYDFETMMINIDGLKAFVEASGGFKEFDYEC